MSVKPESFLLQLAGDWGCSRQNARAALGAAGGRTESKFLNSHLCLSSTQPRIHDEAPQVSCSNHTGKQTSEGASGRTSLATVESPIVSSEAHMLLSFPKVPRVA